MLPSLSWGAPVVKFKRFDELTALALTQLKTLQTTCLPYDDPVYPEKGAVWIGYDGKQPAAFCMIEQSKQWGDTAYLSRSGVLPFWRGRGLQKRMLTIREMWARRRGYVWLISDTTENPASANSLAKRGYQMFQPSNPWANEVSIYWRKKL
jgi:GNAT superfamily N-acetyltransferase